ncbi:MAG: Na/Pi cotransporter family protein, partial [Clostridium sp.]|nr:Na/Pi cotransporter family protein [Clostridium sp.]
LAQERNRKGTDITEEGTVELETIYQYADQAMKLAYESYRDNDIEKAFSVGDVEDKIDKLQRQYRDAHIRRLNKGKCSALAGIHFLDLISNLERIGDHAKNIADTVAEIDDETLHLKNA